MFWSILVLFSMFWSIMVLFSIFGLSWFHLVWFGLSRFYLVCFGLSWFHLVCFGLSCFNLVCFGLSRFYLVCLSIMVLFRMFWSFQDARYFNQSKLFQILILTLSLNIINRKNIRKISKADDEKPLVGVFINYIMCTYIYRVTNKWRDCQDDRKPLKCNDPSPLH